MNKIEGFTPVSDFLCKEYDPMTALVYGKVWRYWDSYGKCSASVERISLEIGLSTKTVQRKLKILETNGLIKKIRQGKTSGITNIWEPTGKIAYQTIVKETIKGRSESPTPRSESPTPSVRESIKDTLEDTKKESSPANAGLPVQDDDLDSYFGGGTLEKKPKAKARKKSQSIVDLETLEFAFAEARGCAAPEWKTDKQARANQTNWRSPLKELLSACDGNVETAEFIIEQDVSDYLRDDVDPNFPMIEPRSFKRRWLAKAIDGNNGHKPMPYEIQEPEELPEVITLEQLQELRA